MNTKTDILAIKRDEETNERKFCLETAHVTSNKVKRLQLALHFTLALKKLFFWYFFKVNIVYSAALILLHQ